MPILLPIHVLFLIDTGQCKLVVEAFSVYEATYIVDLPW